MKSSYQKYADKSAPKSPILFNCIKAFIVGGLVCVLGQAIFDISREIGASEEDAKLIVPIALIFITAILTGVGVFDKIGKFAGAGVLVPITGFANAVVSPAIDNKAEGLVLGLGAKIFIIAGSVILYGTVASTLYGVIYYIYTLIAI